MNIYHLWVPSEEDGTSWRRKAEFQFDCISIINMKSLARDFLKNLPFSIRPKKFMLTRRYGMGNSRYMDVYIEDFDPTTGE